MSKFNNNYHSLEEQINIQLHESKTEQKKHNYIICPCIFTNLVMYCIAI